MSVAKNAGKLSLPRRGNMSVVFVCPRPLVPTTSFPVILIQENIKGLNFIIRDPILGKQIRSSHMFEAKN